MTGKRFDPPRPAWNILKRLCELAQLPTHESDARSLTGNPDFLPDARSDRSPLQTFFGPADYCIGKTVASPERPVSVRLTPAPIGSSGADSGEEEVWA